MKVTTIGPVLLAMAFALAGCGGGGGGGGIASTPVPPTSTSPPPPSIIPAATTSQQFAVMGASHSFANEAPSLLGNSDQLQIRYVASSNSYEVQVPQAQSWAGISFLSDNNQEPVNWGGSAAHLWLLRDFYQYSRLLEWSDSTSIYGHEAIGIATPASGVPLTGSASYAGSIMGFTTEQIAPTAGDMSFVGSIALSFNFAGGSLSGSISPIVLQDFASHPLGAINFNNTVYSTGSTTFSGQFDTAVAGANGFSGLFTGPHAEELIGNFVLPYVSPIDGHTYQSDGAFVAK